MVETWAHGPALPTALAGVAVTALGWRRLGRAARTHLPLGAINGRYLRPPPRVDDPRIGRSQGIPVALRFRVGRDANGFPAGVGALVHERYFSGLPDFYVTVKYACSRPDLLGRSDYANPTSIWYNVFLGYYQVEVKRSEWARPFGYRLGTDGAGAGGTGAGAASTLDGAELASLVKADWHHLSNGLYGVPPEVIAPLDAAGLGEFRSAVEPRVRRPGWDGAWDVASFDGLRVVGPYSSKGGRDYVDRDPVLSRLWRRSFGVYRPANLDGLPRESFTPCRLRTRAFLCHRATVNVFGEPVFHTYVFGGAVNDLYDAIDPVENRRFLDLQMAGLADLIAGERGIGFGAEATNADAPG